MKIKICISTLKCHHMTTQTVETKKMNRQQHTLGTIKIQIIKSILL